MTLGLVPFVAHCLVKLPCWPILLSSCHQTSIWSFLICFFIFSTSPGKFSLTAGIASSNDFGCLSGLRSRQYLADLIGGRGHYLNHYNRICRSVTAEYFLLLYAHLWKKLTCDQVQSWSFPPSQGGSWVFDLDLLFRGVPQSQIRHQHLPMKATFSLWPIPSSKLLLERCQASNLILILGSGSTL